jgi:hypothetical protein
VSDAFTLEEKREGLRKIGVPEPRIEELYPLPKETAAEQAVRLGALEEEHLNAGDKLLRALGFEILAMSHYKLQKKTPGIADRRCYRRPRAFERTIAAYTTRLFSAPAIAFWWEAKSEEGEQRQAQREFEQLVTDCGELYCLGTHADLVTFLIDQGFCVREGDNIVMAPKYGGPAAEGAR